MRVRTLKEVIPHCRPTIWRVESETPSSPQAYFNSYRIRIRDKDLFIGPQEFVVGYSKAPEQPQSSARPICHSHTMTRTGCEPATICIAA